MQMEVHVHGTAFLCRGVLPSQIEEALRNWLDYLEVETLDRAVSIEREEPGIRFDGKEQTLDICWSGMVGRSFHNRLKEAFQALCPLTEYASEITATYYEEDGKEDFRQIFVGPTPQAIHEIRRQCIEEDLSTLLTPYLEAEKLAQAINFVNRLLDEGHELPVTDEQSELSSSLQPHPRNRHLH
jgi:hypothetical protein